MLISVVLILGVSFPATAANTAVQALMVRVQVLDKSTIHKAAVRSTPGIASVNTYTRVKGAKIIADYSTEHFLTLERGKNITITGKVENPLPNGDALFIRSSASPAVNPYNISFEKAREVDATAIGLSALLVSTSRQMPVCVAELHRAGLGFPVLIGGAAINRNFGRRAALLNIDTTWIFVDPRYAMCGHEDPALIANLTRLTAAFRRLGLPIYYSRRDDRSHPTRRGLWNLKLAGQTKLREYTSDPRADEWPEGYAPTAADVTIARGKPSVLFGTPSLIDYIRYDRVDTLVLCTLPTTRSACEIGG